MNKIAAETSKLEEVIMEYLTRLQSGQFGTPTVQDLQFAGALHAALGKRGIYSTLTRIQASRRGASPRGVRPR